ncbi:MAG: ATP-binding cassette domain-containing protein [Oscillospiraceae bacterium]
MTDLVKSFDLEKKILDGISFQVDTGERVGLLGKNGAGKTTLFNILTGDLDYDSGEVLIAPGRRVGLISQIPVYPAGYTVEDVLRSAFQRTTALKEEMDALTRRMEQGDSDTHTLRRYGELTARFEGLGGYDTDTAVNKVSNGLSIDGDMRRRLFDQLSGGEKTRVNLGRLILEDTDILLLDEPTNHLDLQATEWLEGISAPSGAPWSPSPTTAISWTAPSPASSRSWTVRRSFTAATTAFMPLKRSAATRSA